MNCLQELASADQIFTSRRKDAVIKYSFPPASGLSTLQLLLEENKYPSKHKIIIKSVDPKISRIGRQRRKFFFFFFDQKNPLG